MEVWSLPGLHAKVILLEYEDGTRLSIVGSANISDHSNNILDEAVLATEDEDVCSAVSDQLDLWVGAADLVDEDWLGHARTLYREPSPTMRPGRVRRRGVHIDQRARLWVGTSAPPTEPLSPAAEDAYEQAVELHRDDGEVRWWQLSPGDESLLRRGDNVVLVNNPSDRDVPAGQSNVSPPAKIVRIVPGSRRYVPVAILVVDPNLPPYRFRVVRETVENAGCSIDWNKPLDRVAAIDVYRLWFGQPTDR